MSRLSSSSANTLRAATAPILAGIPGLVHGFEQRLRPSGWEEREEARSRVASALAPHGRLFLLKQVHGALVQRAPWSGRPQGDSSVATAPGVLLGVETADCLPILLVDPERRLVGAAHAGWRGTSACVAQATVAALVALGASPERLIAVLGPANNVCCYEVGDELRPAFGADASLLFRPGPRGKPHLDVRLANVRQLERAGLSPERIAHVDDCTHCRVDLYHSYRREGKAGGRMINYIGFSSRC